MPAPVRLMPSRTRSRRAALAGVAGLAALLALGASLPTRPVRAGASPSSGSPSGVPLFTAHLIDTGLAGGYQVVIADMNRDGRPDIVAVASGLHEVRWYENPGWQPHVIVSGIDAPINAAAFDVDGDGVPELALAHGFSNVVAASVGRVSILTHQGDPTGPWAMREIDRVPTSHRLRFVDIDGTGRTVLVNAPLTGLQALAPDYRDHAPLLMYRPGAWTREVISTDDEGVVHGLFVAPPDARRRSSLYTASFTGVHEFRFDAGRWTRTRVVAGDPAPWPKGGASEVAFGRLHRERFIATVEPWHGHQVVVYRQRGGAWTRHVIDSTLADAHTLVTGDFAGDGQDEIIAGERGGHRSVYRYRLVDSARDTWVREVLDDGSMAAAGCAVADLNADQRPDVICIGQGTANLKWYENRGATRVGGTTLDARPTVLFVCEHGTVKSLLAKLLFERYAVAAGLDMRAISRGSAADSAVPKWMRSKLEGAGLALADFQPRQLAAQDLADASHVVSFDLATGVTAAAKAPRAQWDALPAASTDFDASRTAIDARVRALVDSLVRARRTPPRR